jgi:hypothetical protein
MKMILSNIILKLFKKQVPQCGSQEDFMSNADWLPQA